MADDFTAWIGKSLTVTDILDPARCNALRAVLGDTHALDLGDPLPLLFHWLYFWDVAPPVGLGADGHPAKGGFFPPIRLPRRMWAGGRMQFIGNLRVGETISKTSTILKVEAKSGKSGDLVFVTIEHRLSNGIGDAIIEEQDIVYKQTNGPGHVYPATDAPAPVATWQQRVMPDAVLLFRYSALTMNGHRIHYDRPYAINEEGYPALVVHGTLQATLLAGLAAQNVERRVTRFDYRGLAPAFDGSPLTICGNANDAGASLWSEQGGVTTMTATAHCD
jgi:3-methylfumaryl-CoA hydratase